MTSNWENRTDHLYLKLKFNSFNEAIKCINLIADISEKYNHHPIIMNSYTTLELKLTTHDKGNTITDLDFQLAEEINKVISHL
jgi:4a-hydroxytetrahydrobiopterin dehydratase